MPFLFVQHQPGLYRLDRDGPKREAELRIIYICGMKPKPPPEQHKSALLRTLLAGLARYRPAAAEYLDAHRECFTLVSWTHLFYGSHRDMSLDEPGIVQLLAAPDPSPEDIREIASLRRRLLRLWHLFGDSLPWLSRFLARPDLRVTLGEVQRYLRDDDEIGSRVRAMLEESLRHAWQANERVLLIAHSLGSVIAYDCLWELSRQDGERGKVDWFITLGSPLATRFIRKALRGAHESGADKYPGNIRRWLNCASQGEMTALHPRLRPFFGDIVRLGLAEALIDRTDIYNHFRADFGLNVHKSYGYLAHEAVASVVGAWLDELRAETPSARTG